jgi:hypothetical protein
VGTLMPSRGLAAFLAIAACAWHSSACALDVEGVRFVETLRIDGAGQELLLNGAGVRTRFFVKVYAVGLYLTQKVRQGRDALKLAGPKRVSITILMHEITADQFMTAIREKLNATLGTAEGDAIRHGLEHLGEILDAVKMLKRGHTVFLDFVPGSGMRVVINGEIRGNPIPGREFFDALLDGWIGDKPVSESLKRALLGLDR